MLEAYFNPFLSNSPQHKQNIIIDAVPPGLPPHLKNYRTFKVTDRISNEWGHDVVTADGEKYGEVQVRSHRTQLDTTSVHYTLS